MKLVFGQLACAESLAASWARELHRARDSIWGLGRDENEDDLGG